MSATIYKDVSFQGVFAQLGPGFYSGRDLVGCPHQSTSCEDLDNAINSIRVDPNVVVAFADSHAISARGGGARVLVGPSEVSDLTALGMNNRISSILIVPYRAYDSAIPAPNAGVTLYDSYSATGRQSSLRRGDYTKARLASEEVKMPGRSVVSLAVESHVLAILYNGDSFETTADAVVVVGPTVVEDLERLGMGGRVNSIRVMYSDPYDTPGRPTLPLGSARAYTPGGDLGWEALGGGAPPRALLAGLSPGTLDLLAPGSPDPSVPSNWAGAPSPAAAPPAPRPPPGGAGPQVIYVEAPRRMPSWQMFALILVFVLIVAFAAFASGRAAQTPLEKKAAEANLVAQAAVPLVMSAATM